jgi:hypothetical protein
MKNKKGWIRIVEAFLAVLLIAAVLFLVVNQQNVQSNDPSLKVYNYEIYMIRGIELNDTLRAEIVGMSSSILPSTSDNQTTFPSDVINYITTAEQSSLSCAAEICLTNSTCGFWQDLGKDVYAQRVFITSTPLAYNPRQLKLFCWFK